LVANGRARLRKSWHVNSELTKKFPGGVEKLDAAVAAVGDVDVIVSIHRDAVWHVELAGLSAEFAPGHQPGTVLIHFGNPRIDVAIADVGVPSRVPSHVDNLAKHAVHRQQQRLHMLQRLDAFVGGFLLAAKNEGDAAFGVELDDHVRTFVRDPDVVVLVDFYRVGKGPCVELMANLAYKFSVWGELEQWCGGRCVGRSHGPAAEQY